jgi:hypothetical protein
MKISSDELKGCETYRMQMQAIALATQGFWKRNTGYRNIETEALKAVVKLRSDYDRLCTQGKPKYSRDDVLMLAVQAGVFDVWSQLSESRYDKLSPMIHALERFYELAVGNEDSRTT